MRERWLGAVVGIASVAVTYALARLQGGWLIGGLFMALGGWLVGGYIRTLLKMAGRDELTGIANRRPFEKMLYREWERAVRYRRPLSLLFIDVDDFGSVNKLYGHLTGDEALKTISRLLRQSIRQTDVVARWGGEEFVVLLPETDVQSAMILAERIRAMIAQHTIYESGWTLQLTISTGVSGIPGSAQSARGLLRQAIAAEAAAKQYKNTVRCVS